MKIGIVSDEIILNVEKSLGYCKEWGIDLIEVRCLESGRVPYVSEDEINRLIKLKKEYGIKITAISPGIFKNPITETEKYKEELEKHLPECYKLAEKLETDMIIAFGFKRNDGEPDSNVNRVIDVFGEAVTKSKQYGIRISVENEPGFWCDTGENTAKIIKAVNKDNFGANWDPGNAVGNTEVPYPDGYNFIKDHIINVHVKDTKVSSLIECFVVGEGVIDWEGQMKSLLKDKPVNHVTIETHRQPLIENSKRNVDIIRSMIEKYTNN